MGYLGTKPANQITDSTLIADGTVTPADLSTGKPVWDTSGNLTLTGTGTVIESITSTSGTGKKWDLMSHTDGRFLIRQGTAIYAPVEIDPTTYTVGFNGSSPSISLQGGIQFPATQVASANANTLDDYEEGTFTPTLSFSSGSVAYLERSAQYTKIGRMVNCTIAIYLSAVSSPSGDLSITGMPFANGSGERFVSGFTIGLARGFTSSLTITGYISSGSSTIILAKNASNGSYTPLSGSDLGSNTGFYITLTYATT